MVLSLIITQPVLSGDYVQAAYVNSYFTTFSNWQNK